MTFNINLANIKPANSRSATAKRILIPFSLLIVILLQGCDASFYWQAAQGQMDLLQRRQPIPELIQDNATDPQLKSQLNYVLRVRAFAAEQLHLTVNNNYLTYADLQRPYVVWNVFATPELSLENQRWCFPIAGCVPYRGYFTEADADAFAKELAGNGFDTYVGGVAAYSTLGWFDDAVLNTFVSRDQLSLAALLIHELAHQTLYVPDDSTFNESFATAVENIGLELWIEYAKLQNQLPAYQEAKRRQDQFLDLVLQHRDEREKLFSSPLSDDEKRQRKAQLQTELQAAYTQLKARWQSSDGKSYDGYDRWFAQPVNNAQLSTVATYHALEPGFRALVEQSGRDFRTFFKRCR
ncbi:MAG TPA: aminopeptidase, partial [Dongiaceae bacterium]|nr:aminopeptidase [Dongiaceae bacterium]